MQRLSPHAKPKGETQDEDAEKEARDSHTCGCSRSSTHGCLLCARLSDTGHASLQHLLITTLPGGITCPVLQLRKQDQRRKATCLRSHSCEVLETSF